MCDPVSMTVGVVMGAANMAVSSSAASSAAREQNRYRARLGEAADEAFVKTVASVKADVGLQEEALFSQYQQNVDAQKQQLQGIVRDARLAGGSYRALSAETGVEGQTVDFVHQQFEREVLEYESAAVRNLTNMAAQINREAKAIYSRGQSIINSGYPAPLPPASRVDFGLLAMNSINSGLQTGMNLHSAFKAPGT